MLLVLSLARNLKPHLSLNFSMESTVNSCTMGEPSSTASYIRMVQHLIELCLVLDMNKEECMEALSKHASIKPIITSTVWKELEKENKDFFEAYMKDQIEKTLELEAACRIQKMLVQAAAKDFDKES